MEQYRMKDLELLVGKSHTAIRTAFSEDENIKALLPKHTIMKGKRGKAYDDVILDALRAYYGDKQPPENKNAVDEGEVWQFEKTEDAEKTETTPGGSVDPSAATEKELETLRRQVEDLQQQLETERKGREAERADLEKQLQDKEAERRHFIGENAKLLNLLAAEQEEKGKLLLLMPPAGHKTLKQRIKGLFTRKEGGKNE